MFRSYEYLQLLLELKRCQSANEELHEIDNDYKNNRNYFQFMKINTSVHTKKAVAIYLPLLSSILSEERTKTQSRTKCEQSTSLLSKYFDLSFQQDNHSVKTSHQVQVVKAW